MIARLLSLALIAAAVPAGAQQLPGVADEETAIASGGISQFHRGNGDVLFVLDNAGRWYRVALNRGCLSGSTRIYSVAFDTGSPTSRIDRFASVYIDGTTPVTCRIASIRRSEAPPQVDSKSRVSLD